MRLCVLAATGAVVEATPQTAFSSWLGQQPPEIAHEELALRVDAASDVLTRPWLHH